MYFHIFHSTICSVTVLLPGILLAGILCLGIYNLFFHPYASYPGPFWARVSPFYALWHAYVGDLHVDVLLCHERYDSVIRYSPNRLIFNTTSGLKAIYGQGRNLQKSKGYAPHPYFPTVFNTHNCIDKKAHARKRRIVSQGFSESVISASETYVLDHVRNLCDELLSKETTGLDGWTQPRDMALWTNYFTLDVISDLTFGRSFNMIKNPDLRWLVDAIVNGNRHIYMRFAFPPLFNLNPSKWYAPARWLFPGMEDDRTRFAGIAEQYSQERMDLIERGISDRKDIMSALLAAHDPKTGEKLTQAEVWSEAHLMIAAGGDTTSTALAAVLFYLSRNREAYTRLAAEIRQNFDNVESIRRGENLSSCRYLKACIDEANRLAPAAPGALWREASHGGAMVDGHYIPAGYDVGVCTYSLSHNAEYFDQPFQFRPERFLEEFKSTNMAPLRHDPDANAPFSIGPRGCLAKPLAYLELTLLLARMIWLMDFESVDSTGEGHQGLAKGRQRPEEFQIVDMFSSNKQGPILRFKPRLFEC